MPDHNSGDERNRLAELYAAMADEELQLLARDFASLSPEGQEALEAEFRRRDLIPEVDLHTQNQGQDVMEWDDSLGEAPQIPGSTRNSFPGE